MRSRILLQARSQIIHCRHLSSSPYMAAHDAALPYKRSTKHSKIDSSGSVSGPMSSLGKCVYSVSLFLLFWFWRKDRDRILELYSAQSIPPEVLLESATAHHGTRQGQLLDDRPH